MPHDIKCITHESGNEEGWVCVCNNTPSTGGFFPCDLKGNEIEPVKGWNRLYVCDRCGRIIEQDTLKIVAHRRLLRLPLLSN